MTTAMVLVMVLLLLMGFPLMVPLLTATVVGFLVYLNNLDPVIIAQQMVGGVKPAALVAVPMFIFAADIMTQGQAADRLMKLVERFVGHLRGGLPITTAVSCTLFGAVSGSTQATVVAIGGPLRPRLMSHGYKDSFTTALIINASDIALLIPPSIGMIIYGVVTGTSIGDLFLGGIGPGLLVLLAISIYAYIYSVRHGHKGLERATWSQRLKAFKGSLLPLGFPAIIIGGIYGGIFSPTEAAAISVLYAIILEVFVFQELKLKELPQIAKSTGLITGVVFILVATGAAFSWLISYAEIPQMLIYEGLELSAESSRFKILGIMCVTYFIGCMFVDPIVVILILAPIFHPLAVNAGVDPVLVGVLVTMQAALGSATPPFGCDIFTAIAIFKKPYLDVVRGTPPFIFILIACTLLIMLFPPLTLFFL